jgi:hypothetical protein
LELQKLLFYVGRMIGLGFVWDRFVECVKAKKGLGWDGLFYELVVNGVSFKVEGCFGFFYGSAW